MPQDLVETPRGLEVAPARHAELRWRADFLAQPANFDHNAHDGMSAEGRERWRQHLADVSVREAQERPAPSGYRVAAPRERSLSQPERRFMLRNCGRMEAELRHLVATNPTVRACWEEAERGGLSETSAAELAVIALEREVDDFKRQLLYAHHERLPVVPVVAED